MGSNHHGKFFLLDGLRGVAALLVITRHTPQFFEAVSVHIPNKDGPIAIGPFWSSYLAVDFFFCLSGFVIAFAYEQKIKSGKLSIAEFVKVRTIRLAPLYMLSLVLSAGAILNLARHDPTYYKLVPDLAFGMVFLPSFGSQIMLYPFNPPVWSLFYEFIANVAYRLFAASQSNARLVAIICISGVLLVCAVHEHWFGFNQPEIGPLDSGFQWQGWGAGLLRVTFSFFTGVGVFRLWASGRYKIVVPPILIAACLTLALVAHPPARWQSTCDLACVCLLFPILVFLGAHVRVSGLSSKACEIGGVTSYAIYVLHVPAYSVVTQALAHYPISQPMPLWIGISFLFAMLVITLVLDKIYDRPVRKWLRRHTSADTMPILPNSRATVG